MAQAVDKSDGYLAGFQALQRELEGLQPAWLCKLRAEAWERFGQLGFPTARRGNERWKYTNVAPIARATFHLGHSGPQNLHPSEERMDEEVKRLAPIGSGWTVLAFVNGRYSEGLSTAPDGASGLRVSSLGEVARSNGGRADVAREHLGRYASPQDDAFAALNTAFLGDGAYVEVPDRESVSAPIHLLYLSTGEQGPTVSHPRALVVAGRESQVTVVESYVGLSGDPGFTNSVTEMALDEGAQVEHHSLLMEDPQGFHVGITRVRQGKDSHFSSASFARGMALARNELLVTLDAPGSSCSLSGLYLTTDSQHVDNLIDIDHAMPHTTSRLNYKGILDGKSRAVFGGTVLVRPNAQKADAQQSDKNLVLSSDAEVDSKPSLLIYADDVRCGHGATAGNIDEEALFYMRSRGLDRETAGRLLVHGFASEIIEMVSLEPLRTYLDRLFLNALPGCQFGEA